MRGRERTTEVGTEGKLFCESTEEPMVQHVMRRHVSMDAWNETITAKFE